MWVVGQARAGCGWMTSRPAGVGGAGGGGQTKIAISHHGHGLCGRADGRAETSLPAAERRDGLFILVCYT